MPDAPPTTEAQDDERRFQDALRPEVLASERVRCLALAGIFGFFFAFFTIATNTIGAKAFDATFKGELSRLLVSSVLAGFALYELGVSMLIRRALRTGRSPPQIVRFVNAFVEVSLPTFGIWHLGSIFPPAHVVIGPTVFVYFLFIIASVLRLSPALSLFTGAVAATQFYALVRWAQSHPVPAVLTEAAPEIYSDIPNRGRTFFLFMSGVVAALVARRLRDHVLRNMLRAERDRTHIYQVFGQHVSPAVVNRLLQQRGELPSEVRFVCVMFLDIRDFTTFAEKRRPEEVVTYLNTLFSYMIDAVDRHHGIVNKFLGDGFMAVFGAPFSDGAECRNAIAAAREILTKTAALDASLPPPRLGIGLHAGEAVTGHVGSADRKEYTIIGDVVNVASRIEGLNKQFTSQLLISGEVLASAGNVEGASPRGPANVKGRQSAVEIFQLA